MSGLKYNFSIGKFKTFIPFALLAIIYLAFKSDTSGFGDALGFLTTVTIGYDIGTNTTNHFLYVNLMSAFANNIPGGTLFDKSVYFSIIFSLATLAQIFRIIYLITKDTRASLAAIIMLGLSFTYWRQSEIIEVYTFNNFLFTSMLYYIIKDFFDKGKKNALIVSIFFGFALLAHIQNILLIPFYLLYLYLSIYPDYRKISAAIFLTVGIASVLILVPLIWKTNSLLSVFFENENFLAKATSFDLSILLKGILKSIGYFFYNFLFFSFFIIHGCYILFKNDKKLFFILSLAFLPFWAFACRYDVPDNYVFFLSSYIVLTIMSGYSFSFWIKKYKYAYYLIPVQLLSFPLVYFLIWQISLKVPQLKSLNEAKAYKGGLKYLLWPGMKDNGDLVKLSKEIYLTGKKPDNFEEFEWNYKVAIKYLKITGEIK
jgi:hypothetical protein